MLKNILIYDGLDYMKKILALFLCAMILSSCTLAQKLGFDTYDYMSEKVVQLHANDGEVADEITEILGILTTDSTHLTTFENMTDAIREYRDAVLTYMLETNYLKYSGNTDMIERAAREYPEYNITQIIPQSEFEATMYRYFGGNVKITHKDGGKFKYLSKVSAYISPVMPTPDTLKTEITYLGETAKTYRVKFYVVSDTERSEEYFALIIKRDDGTLYIKKLLKSADME